MNEQDLLFALLRREVCGGSVDQNLIHSLSQETIENMYLLADRHDLAHLSGQALSNLGMLGNDEISKRFNDCTVKAVYRYLRINHEYSKICKAFEEIRIPFIPLKGAVLRNVYPEPWMRTSCDIDILIHEEHLEAASEVLTGRLKYVFKGRSFHDLSFYSPNNVHFELHYQAIGEIESGTFDAVLARLWEMSYPQDKGSYLYIMQDEMFYFYHIAHMAKHFRNGGCGVRPFLDLWILNHNVDFDKKRREDLLKEGGLLAFGNAAMRLSEVWFSCHEHDTLTEGLEQYVLTGGVYGTFKNNLTVVCAKEGGKVRALTTMIFLPYDVLKYHYPILQQTKWLSPFCYLFRCVKLILDGRASKLLRVIRVNTNIAKDEAIAMQNLFNQLDL